MLFYMGVKIGLYIARKTQGGDVWEEGAEEDIWPEEGRGNRGVEKTT